MKKTKNKIKASLSVGDKSKRKRLKLGTYILAIVIIIMTVIIVLSGGLSAIFNWVLANPVNVPDLIWIVVISAVSSIVTYFVMKKFIVSPLSVLEKAMDEVAKGDFSVHLETNSRIDEIKKSYDSFNIMVKELKSTELLQSDFVANVSHEFKTPISAIEGYSTLLKGEVNSAEGSKYIDKILSSAKRLNSLIGEILLLSKIENQGIQDKPKVFRLDEQIRQAVVMFSDKLDNKNIDLTADLDKVYFNGNEKLLFHVWANLIDNAIKFSPSNGKVSLQLKSEDGAVVFAIKDNGLGISESAKKHVFDKFFQEDNSHNKEGNGLGLTLVKRIVTVHGGAVEATDNPLGGAIFTVTLPA